MGKIVEVFSSAARTATPTDVDVETQGASHLLCVIDCTAITATPSVVFTLRAHDPVSGKDVDLLASAAITATGTTTLRMGPGLTAAANVTANEPLPPTLTVNATHADADSITYSVALMLN